MFVAAKVMMFRERRAFSTAVSCAFGVSAEILSAFVLLVWSCGAALAQATEVSPGVFIYTLRWEAFEPGQYRFAAIYDKEFADDPANSVQFMLAMAPANPLNINFAYASANKGKIYVRAEDGGAYYIIKVPSISLLNSQESGHDLVISYQGSDAVELTIPSATVVVILNEAFANAPAWLRERW